MEQKELFIEAIRSSLIQSFIQVNRSEYRGIKEWFAKKEYTPDKYGNGKLFLTVTNPEKLVGALSSDCKRFSMAAFESIHSLLEYKKESKTTSWIVVKSYYSAFYGAHATLRMFGKSCTNFNQDQIDELKEVCKLYSINLPKNFTSGPYIFSFNYDLKVLSIEKAQDQKGGSHVFMWKEYTNLIEGLAEKVIQTSESGGVIYAPVSKQLKKLAEILKMRKGNGSSLSEIRNQVSYEHLYGSWFPHIGASKKTIQQIKSAIAIYKVKGLNYDISAEKPANELMQVMISSQFICAICFGILKDINDLNEKSIHKSGIIQLLNSVKIK
ncbi:MAG: hypothetical protein KBD78_06635 [Oligoflexales bacterium]|nr:hypothetical protein [Oligoflexales bacterium]